MKLHRGKVVIWFGNLTLTVRPQLSDDPATNANLFADSLNTKKVVTIPHSWIDLTESGDIPLGADPYYLHTGSIVLVAVHTEVGVSLQ